MRCIRSLLIFLVTGSLFVSGCGLGGVQAPSALSYNAVTAVYTLGVVIAPNSPISTITSFRVSPALPAGLSLSPSAGIISGTPSLVRAQGSYTVTASNASGSATAALTIAVNEQAPTALIYTAQTAMYAIHSPISPNIPTSADPTVNFAINAQTAYGGFISRGLTNVSIHDIDAEIQAKYIHVLDGPSYTLAYHGMLKPPFCLQVAKQFFDQHR